MPTSAKSQATKDRLKNLSEQQRKEILWRAGILVPWKGHAVQQQMADSVKNFNGLVYVINSSRRLGKSYLFALLALERAIQKPGSQIKYACTNQKAARKIVLPIMKQILTDCPKNLRPEWRGVDGYYEFENGSEIHIAGSEQQQVDSLRGQACDLALGDEAGFMTDLEYLIESVLMPQFLTRQGGKIILASTPPISPDHPFVAKYIPKAMANDAYSKFTIYDNPMLSPEVIEQYKIESGGENSTAWRREYLAEIVTDTSMALFPEADDELIDKITFEIRRPDFFLPFTAVDLGYVDYTAAVFGYYHFPLGKIVIEDELLMNKSTSAEIIQAIQQKEQDLWGENAPRRRVVDGNAQQIADWNGMHRFSCFAPSKMDLEANVNRVRMHLSDEKFIFHPRVKQLRSQVQYAIWDNSRRKFSRSSDGGHWDLCAALIYFCKHLDQNTNPTPPGYGLSHHTHWNVPKKHPNSKSSILRRFFPNQFTHTGSHK